MTRYCRHHYSYSVEFANDGGPMIVLPAEALSFWQGEKRIVDYQQTDYDRACDVQDWAAILNVGQSWGMILGDEVPTVQWIELAESEVTILAVTLYANNPSVSASVEAYESHVSENFIMHQEVHNVQTGILLLMHAASSGKDFYHAFETMPSADIGAVLISSLPRSQKIAMIGDALFVRVVPGPYVIKTHNVDIPGEAHYVFHSFRHSAKSLDLP